MEMKFLVSSLPYYGDLCPFLDNGMCWVGRTHEWECPRKWGKDFVCSSENPHECEMLKEVNEDA